MKEPMLGGQAVYPFVKQKVMAYKSKAVPVARGRGGSTAAFTALAPFAVAPADRRPDWTLKMNGIAACQRRGV